MKKTYTTLALIDMWDDVYRFLVASIEENGLDGKVDNNVLVACEEIFVNIAMYAYKGLKSPGSVHVVFIYDEKKNEVCITFTDRGIKFDPTKVGRVDTSLSASDRKVGGLGIFLAKKIVDQMEYAYVNDENILKLIKKL